MRHHTKSAVTKRRYLVAVFFAVIGLAFSNAPATATDPLPTRAQTPFQHYQDVAHRFTYKAFAVAGKNGQWGQGTQLGTPGSAVDMALRDCQQRSAQTCRIYAVGSILVTDMADRTFDIAVMLNQVKPLATNGDLAALTSPDGGEAVAALRRSVLLIAATMGRTNAVTAMLDLGTAIDARSVNGATPLSNAASRGRRETVALLLKRGANVTLRNGVGKTALGVVLLANNFARPRDYLAADHRAVIRMLKDAGATD